MNSYIHPLNLFSEIISKFGFKIENQHFDCIDFVDNRSQLTANGENFEVFTSPYSLGGVYEDDS